MDALNEQHYPTLVDALQKAHTFVQQVEKAGKAGLPVQNLQKKAAETKAKLQALHDTYFPHSPVKM